MSKHALYLIPSLLGEGDPKDQLSTETIQVIISLKYFIVENEKNARRFLVGCGMRDLLDQVEFGILSEHTKPEDYGFIMEPVMRGQSAGIISDAGCPGVADPGAEMVSMAHFHGITVVPLVGPSSILLALMASGMNGQEFAFRGYLPVKPPLRIKRIKELENRSRQFGETQIFIEAPYRNNQLLADLIRQLHPETRLTLAVNLTQADAFVQTKSVKNWKRQTPDINKRPAVFLILATE